MFPSCPDFGSAPQAWAIREHKWCHIVHLLFGCRGIPGLGGSLAVTLLRDYLFKAGSGSDHARAVLLSTFPSNRTPAVAAPACMVPFLLHSAAKKLTCPSLCAGALWPMPAWVWRDFRSFVFHFCELHGTHRASWAKRGGHGLQWCLKSRGASAGVDCDHRNGMAMTKYGQVSCARTQKTVQPALCLIAEA